MAIVTNVGMGCGGRGGIVRAKAECRAGRESWVIEIAVSCVPCKDRLEPAIGEERSMDKLSLQNPVFATYVIAATIMILKAVSMSWLTVVRMMQVKGGFRSPEDIKKTPLNPDPNPKQLEPNERVERISANSVERPRKPAFLPRGWLAFRSDRAVANGRALASVRLRSIAAFALCGLFHRADP